MEIKRTINIKNEEETKEFGLKIGQEAVPGQVIGLIGDLGTGKTTLTKYIARGLGVEENISSPTFMIVREYHGGRMPLYHFDVYRIGDPEELFDIGADEYFDGDGLCVVEWIAFLALCHAARPFVQIRAGTVWRPLFFSTV